MRLIDADEFENYVFDEWVKNEISNSEWMTFRELLKEQESVVEFDGDITEVIVKGEKYAKPEQWWIPCSVRLPNKDGLYLVTTSKGQIQVHVFTHNGNSKEYWIRCNKAWMPLPEPYGGEQK